MVAGGSIDVNLLLTRLLAKGLIGQTDTSPAGSQSPPAETGSAALASDAAATSDVLEVHVLLFCTHITQCCYALVNSQLVQFTD